MNNVLQVAVIGRAGLGKSLVAQIITEALQAKGFDAVFIEDEHPARDTETIELATDAIQARGTKIGVCSVQARRDGTFPGILPLNLEGSNV